MALTKRMDVLGDVVCRFGLAPGIVTAESRRDTGNNPFTADECPAVNVTIGNDTVDENCSQDDHHLQYKAELFTSSETGEVTVEDLFPALTDTILANDTWGGYADGTGSPTVDTSDTYEVGDIISNGTISFVVHYTTDKGKI